jgi:alpha-L-rhamnosidase
MAHLHKLKYSFSHKYLSFFLFLLLSSFVFASTNNNKVILFDLKCEHLSNPLSIGTDLPRFSWKIQSDKRGVRQTAYRIIVADNIDNLKLHKGNYWDSGKIISNQSQNVRYGGRRLTSRLKLYWKVIIWDENNEMSNWSEPALFETGLLNKTDWIASWIGTGNNIPIDSAKTGPAPYFRKEIVLHKGIKSARVYVCGLGFYELYINGKKVGNQVLAPAVTNYDVRNLKNVLYPYDDKSTQRVLYNTFDVSELLKNELNTIGLVLGNGWYNQRDRTVEGNMWYDSPRLILQLEVVDKFGGQNIISSDSTWKFATGPILHDGIFTGEVYDARMQFSGWNRNGYNDNNWINAKLVRSPKGDLHPQTAPFDKISRTISPSSVKLTNDSTYLFSIDEMISGWVELKVKGKAGDKITLRFFGEEGKSFNQTDVYILRGGEEEHWEPRFTWHTFRNIEVVSKNIPLNKRNLIVKVINTDIEVAGSFTCSNTLFNKIYENYLRTQHANFHGSVSSDCPHRERLGYTGDAQVLTESSIFSFDMIQFYRKWFNDVEDARNKKTGYIPHTAPFGGGGGGPAWGSAFVIMPWKYYCYYGDQNVLKDHYEGMKQWISYLKTRTDERGIITQEEPNGWCLGDWSAPYKIEIPESLVNTCYYYYVTDLIKKIAAVLGKEEDCLYFAKLAVKIKDEFNKIFFDPQKNNYWEGRQGSNVFPLAFGMVPKGKENNVFNSLLLQLEKTNYHFDTGILATPLLLNVLTERNRVDIAYRLMDQKDFPSYGYPILQKGATCLWEDWDGRSSHCHPMFGSVCAWFYKSLAGINYTPGKPGMQNFTIAPNFIDSLTSCKATYNSIYGKIVCNWIKKNNSIVLDIEIPANTTADIFLPSDINDNIFESGKRIDTLHEIHLVSKMNGKTVLQIGSGKYHFEVNK